MSGQKLICKSATAVAWESVKVLSGYGRQRRPGRQLQSSGCSTPGHYINMHGASS